MIISVQTEFRVAQVEPLEEIVTPALDQRQDLSRVLSAMQQDALQYLRHQPLRALEVQQSYSVGGQPHRNRLLNRHILPYFTNCIEINVNHHAILNTHQYIRQMSVTHPYLLPEQ